jgi:beta-glucanase (GH16 family)
MKLVFEDDFSGSAKSAPDTNKWTTEIGGAGWGNKELEYYTSSAENAYIDGSGSLVIKAVKTDPATSLACWYGPCRYTSARLKTKGKFDLRYGRFEARIKIPRGQGVWPAFWLLGSNIDTVSWPWCGEIDIMENIGREPSMVHGTVHGPGYSGVNGIGQSYSLPDNARFADDFHIFAVEWSGNGIQFLVDGQLYFTVTPASLPQGTAWAFGHPFFLLLNVAVGGSWPGNPDATTVFPQQMLVDYVRVYQHRSRLKKMQGD